MPPVFELGDHFDTTVTIFGRVVPITVKRYPRAESDELWRRSQLLNPRGSAPATDAADKNRETLAFFEEVITSSVTLDEGVIVDRGRSITDGAGLIELFYNCQHVLAALAAAVIIENRVMPSLAKNSNSLRVTDTGSARSSEAPSERSSERTAGPAASSDSASPSDAEVSSATRVAASESSGTPSEATAPA